MSTLPGAFGSNNGGLGNPAQRAASFAASVPLGTFTVVVVSLVFEAINLLSGHAITHATWISSTQFVHSPFLGLPRFLGFTIVHSGLLHYIFAVMLFPFAAYSFEQNVGTLPFLYTFLLFSVLSGTSYVIVLWLWSWIFPDWGLFYICGLDIPFFSFLMFESLSKRGIYETAVQFGVNIPEVLYPLPVIGVLLLIMPYTSWIVHTSAAFMGLLYFLGVFEAISLTNAQIHALESSGMFAWFVTRPGFVSAPGAVALPTVPGGYPDLMNPTQANPADASGSRGSIVDRIKSAFGQSTSAAYTAVGNSSGSQPSYQAGQNPDVDPLLWDEEDDLEANHNSPAKPSAGAQGNSSIPGAF